MATTLPAGAELASLLHAVAKLGAVLAPVNTRLTAAERRSQLDAAAPRVVVHEPLAGEKAVVELRDRVDPEAPWTLLFTAGTSGAPKPVLLSHRNHAASALASAWALGVAPDDRWLCPVPLFHVAGLAILARCAAYATQAIVHERFDADAVAAALSGGAATLVSVVPTMLARLLDAGVEAHPALRTVVVGGAGTPAALLRRAAERGLPIVRTYGMTEAASQVATAPGLTADAALDTEPPGARPLPGVELRVAADGEVLVRGAMVSRDALAPDGWLHTGDRGRLDDEGALHVDGRLDDVIVTGGENVAAAEVEDALLAHPTVADAAVAGEPDPEWGSAVVAYVVPTAGAAPAPGELTAHCRARLAGFKVPKEIRLVESLPRNAAGKLVRRRLGSVNRIGSAAG